MRRENDEIQSVIPALKVRQWITDWENITWDNKRMRSEPQHWFYQFTIPSTYLKALSGIYARTTKGRVRGADDLGIQRRHEKSRSEEIARFIKLGFPWSDISKTSRDTSELRDLQKPGWLPTAIVVNILQERDERLGKKVDKDDLIHVKDHSSTKASIKLPNNFSGMDWRSKSIPPIEIIDGQHRLWAFEDIDFEGDYELPVIAFVGLDLSWQAYLFYTINIKPKKINASLAFDLYPLLRTEDWLLKFEGHVVYRESRAQELVDMLWSFSKSPWYQRINMLGEPGFQGLMVSQAAWIRSLLATYVKRWEGPGIRIGGLFGSPVGSHQLTLSWSRFEQAAFLIVLGRYIKDAISNLSAPWMEALRELESPTSLEGDEDLAFYGQYSLLNQDQGVRAVLHASNDFCFIRSDKLSLESWGGESDFEGTDEECVSAAIQSLKKQKRICTYLKSIATSIAHYDWRSSSTPGLSEEERLLKAAFRGSGGYKELRRHLLRHIARGETNLAMAAKEVLKALGY